ncbi:Arm DNA-binding domain-containing protein [Salegentibacter salegens]|uniref:Phage integrase SAM-like domain-containing protein n=1 Tax=Salegentibacter salegens TaxID=143223 RepID=A0A1M7MQB6_9FLAO|nr:Arm DNA-binding domain-containing protein [Salegentibacter salegens]PRX52597.1 integrase-like protein [Salegentibacter salegens]SHM92700.1 Phage integrase SAM-like domain-containing protein [Salegentibacter salegens]
MQNLLSILFYIKRSKTDKQGKVPIYMRITYDGKRAEVSTMRKVELNKWNSKANCFKGQSSEAKSINRHLDIMKNRLYSIFQKLQDSDENITATILN